MTGLEILFITNVIILLMLWIWFVVLGFQTSREWGLGLLFLFPLSPFLFAYRFERKTRKVIYYFVASLALFGALNGWIYFATIDFFPTFSQKFAGLAPKIDSTGEIAKPKLNLPKPTPIPEPLPVVEKPKVIKETPHVASHHYKSINLESAHSYIGKKVIISTAIVVHHGILKSVGVGQLEIRKDLAGGTTVMGIPKNKIKKIEVYL